MERELRVALTVNLNGPSNFNPVAILSIEEGLHCRPLDEIQHSSYFSSRGFGDVISTYKGECLVTPLDQCGSWDSIQQLLFFSLERLGSPLLLTVKKEPFFPFGRSAF